MSDDTNIEWCDSTFNPWRGCTPVGPGCDHCYAAALSARWGGPEYASGATRLRTTSANWRKPLQWEREAADFQAAHGRRRRVFCASLADVFDNEIDKAWRSDLFELIARTPSLDWLLLTKRIGNAAKMMDAARLDLLLRSTGARWPLPNVWLGATVVNQAEADRDITKLLDTPAAVRFLSIEPMLGPVDLSRYHDWLGRSHGGMWCPDCPEHGVGIDPDEHRGCHGEVADASAYDGIDWVIAGGESGSGARPSNPQWYRDLRDQCAAAGVPFLFKQWGEYSSHEIDADSNIEPGLDMGRMGAKYLRIWRDGWEQPAADTKARDVFAPGTVLAQRVGKAAAGRLLDGVQHDGYPGARA